MENQQAKVSSVEEFGVFLDNGGFIHIADVSQHLGRRINSKEELAAVLPPGSNVEIVLKEMKEAIRGQVHYLLVDFNKDQ